MGGRLFQRLEEGVCGRAGDLVRFVDDVDLGAKLGGRVADALPEIPDVVDAAVAGGVDLDDVRRGAGIDGHGSSRMRCRGAGSGRRARQLIALASTRAVVVFPVPRGPQKR